MSDPKYVGGVIPYSEAGYEYNVTFKCYDEKDSDTGITFTKIRDIEVTDQIGRDANHMIDMDRVSNKCYNHASDAIANKMRTDDE